MPAHGAVPSTAKILIAEDDEGVTRTFARMLRLEGFQVLTAVNAEAGLREWLEDLVGLTHDLLKVTP